MSYSSFVNEGGHCLGKPLQVGCGQEVQEVPKETDIYFKSCGKIQQFGKASGDIVDRKLNHLLLNKFFSEQISKKQLAPIV